MVAKKIFLGCIVLFNIVHFQTLKAQSLKHPSIWITEAERNDVLEKISKYDWAKSMSDQLHNHVDKKKEVHISKPEIILNSIPAFGDHLEKHNAILTLAAESGMLYYLTKEESYAQLSADIIAAYSEELFSKSSETTKIMGDAFLDPRTTYPMLAIAYDFVYEYLKRGDVKIFNNKTGQKELFENSKAQQTFKNIIGNILQEYGKPDKHGNFISNHPVLTAPGAFYTLLCIEDDLERERLFSVFWESGTKHQPSFKHTILPMFSGQGIWPESLSYSFMPNVSLVLNIIDRIKPAMNVTKDNQHIFEGNFLFSNLRMPDRRFVRFGDSKRNHDSTKENYSFALNIAERKGYTNLKKKSQIELIQSYKVNGGRKPEISNGPYDDASYLQLFWGLPILEREIEDFDYKPTVIVKHAGVALQRNYVEKNNELYGLCGIIGGAHYVHSHVTGITMELYGAGYVMAPNAGLPKSVSERKIPLHENYFRLYAGNNTVIVNGTSHGLQPGSWKDGAYVWQNTTVNIASEPKHLEDPISQNFSFATQFLKDEVNNVHQERTLSTIRTSEKTAYYFDLFRSKSLDENKFQDYIYHNIGDETSIRNNKNEPLKLEKTARYQNDIGDPVQSPGWRYFENTQVTKPIKDAVKITFHIKKDDRFMHLFVPEGAEREYTKALAPATREAKNGYEKKKTQVLAIRQQGEAWQKPFIAVFEPSINSTSSVQNVEPLMDGEKVVGAKVTSNVENVIITDYIISQDKSDATYINRSINLKFEGRFAIVRIEESRNKKKTSLYIGEGKKISFKNYDLESDTQNKGFKLFD
jgi:hypothetical protein